MINENANKKKIGKCLTMIIRTRLHYRRYSYIVCCLLIVLLLGFYFRVFQSHSDTDADDWNRSSHCDQSIIRKHYMHDQSPQQLFAQEPVQPAFTYELSNGNFCSSLNPHALIFVVSKSSNYGSRDAIRRTWGNFAPVTSMNIFSHLRLKLLFLIDIDETQLLNINLEQSIFHDLVQVRLPQHYTLSTYRDMSILHWTETYCSQAMMTLKTDDDIFLNTFLLANVLSRILANMTVQQSKKECKYAGDHDPLAIIYGIQIHNAKVVRDSNDRTLDGLRYIVTDDEYPCRYYPNYMSGFGYIVNQNARFKLLCAFFRREKSFHMSDVYVTGILPEYMNIQRENLRLQISYRSTEDCDLFFSQMYAYACASPLHFSRKESSSLMAVHIFERFNVYWKRIYQNRNRSPFL